MEKRDLVATGVGLFGAINLAYIGYALYKNYKDYKNKEGVYAEEEPKQTQTELLDDEDLILVEEVQEPIKVSKRKVKKSFYIGVGLLCVAAIGGYSYGFKSGHRTTKKEADKLIETYNAVIDQKEKLEKLLKERLEKAEVDVERITSNALNMLLPEHMETRWVTFDDKSYHAQSHYTPKVTKDLSSEDIASAVKETWDKLYNEPVVVVPAVEEG